MIIFGTRSSTLKQSNNNACYCDNCNNKDTVNYYVSGSYFHIFWIPMFPLSKKVVSQCHHCKQVLHQKEMTPAMKQDGFEALKFAKRPITHYLGLIAASIFAVFVIGVGMFGSAKKSKYLGSPQVNDLYEVKEDRNMYTLYKITGIQGDSISFKIHNQIVEKPSQLTTLKIHAKDDYADETIKFSKAQLHDMNRIGTIFGIDRD